MKQGVVPGSAVVILGGFLSPGVLYTSMSEALRSSSGLPVWVVATQTYDWLPAITKLGWARILDKLDRTVQKAVQASSNGRVILVGHSAGGVLARLYLSPEPFLGRRYNGMQLVQQLITLGSPHINQGGLQRGGNMSRWIQRHVPDAAFAPQVRYISLAGKYIQGRPHGTLAERMAARVYKEICGDATAWGDGLIPLQAALLPGSEQVVLEGVSHYALFGEPWYGSESALPAWWHTISQQSIV